MDDITYATNINNYFSHARPPPVRAHDTSCGGPAAPSPPQERRDNWRLGAAPAQARLPSSRRPSFLVSIRAAPSDSSCTLPARNLLAGGPSLQPGSEASLSQLPGRPWSDRRASLYLIGLPPLISSLGCIRRCGRRHRAVRAGHSVCEVRQPGCCRHCCRYIIEFINIIPR